MPGKGWTVPKVLWETTKTGLENTLNRWYSFYPSKVMDDQDPSQQGKVRVSMEPFGILESHDKFMYPVSPFAGRNHGFYFPQHEGEAVWVTCDMGDSNVLRTHGGWWLNEDSQDPKRPTGSYIPGEFNNKDGGAPTARGIKSKRGHVVIFEDAEDNPHVEISSGRTEIETTTTKDPKTGVESTTSAIKLGAWAEKHHRVRLDDENEELVIATFGAQNDNAAQPSEEDANKLRQSTELSSRFRHWLLMRDKSDDRFVQLKSIGTADPAKEDKYHQLLMSDKDGAILLQTTGDYLIRLDDGDGYIRAQTADDFHLLLDNSNKSIELASSNSDYKLLLDKENKLIELSTPNHTFEFSDTDGTLIDDVSGKGMTISTDAELAIGATGNIDVNTEGDFSKTVRGNEDVTISGDLTMNITGSLTQNVTNAVKMLFSNTLQINATSITITGSSIELGGGATFALVNELFLTAFDSHTHEEIGLPGAFTLPPTVPSLPIHKTTITKAS